MSAEPVSPCYHPGVGTSGRPIVLERRTGSSRV